MGLCGFVSTMRWAVLNHGTWAADKTGLGYRKKSTWGNSALSETPEPA